MSIKRFLKAFSCAVGVMTTGICMVGIFESLPPDIKPLAIVGVLLFMAVSLLTWCFYENFDD